MTLKSRRSIPASDASSLRLPPSSFGKATMAFLPCPRPLSSSCASTYSRAARCSSTSPTAPRGPFYPRSRRDLGRIFPDKTLARVPREHVLYKSFFLARSPRRPQVSRSRSSSGIVRRGIASRSITPPNDLAGAMSRDEFGQWEYDVGSPAATRRASGTFRLGINVAHVRPLPRLQRRSGAPPLILQRRGELRATDHLQRTGRSFRSRRRPRQPRARRAAPSSRRALVALDLSARAPAAPLDRRCACWPRSWCSAFVAEPATQLRVVRRVEPPGHRRRPLVSACPSPPPQGPSRYDHAARCCSRPGEDALTALSPSRTWSSVSISRARSPRHALHDAACRHEGTRSVERPRARPRQPTSGQPLAGIVALLSDGADNGRSRRQRSAASSARRMVESQATRPRRARQHHLNVAAGAGVQATSPSPTSTADEFAFVHNTFEVEVILGPRALAR